MTIFQCDDSLERRNFIESKNIRPLNSFENGKYSDFIINQYHPKDLPGALVEIDSVRNTNYREKYADWPPAGNNWRQYINEDYVSGIIGATIASTDPKSLSELWSEVLDSELSVKNNMPVILLENAEIKFTHAKDNYTDLVGLDIKASEKRINIGSKVKLLGLDINFV